MAHCSRVTLFGKSLHVLWRTRRDLRPAPMVGVDMIPTAPTGRIRRIVGMTKTQGYLHTPVGGVNVYWGRT
jgi:hypothetical protein